MTLTADQARERDEAIRLRRYDEGVVKSCTHKEGDDYASLSYGSISYGSMGCGWPTEHGPIPKEGDVVRLYGGFGYVIEGGDLNGMPVWYKTAAERKVDHQQMVADMTTKKKARFEEGKAELDAEFDRLPDNFRARIQRFREADPDFRWDSEGYEMFPLSRAAALLDHLEQDGMYEKLHEVGAKVPHIIVGEGITKREYDMTPEEMTDAWEDTLENRVLAWHYLSTKPMGYNSKAQAEVVPNEVSGNDAHSGNTYGAMISFARRQAVDPGFEC